MKMEIVGRRSPIRFSAARAFTLGELLAMIAIIAVLAALLLPALSKGKSQAHATTCKNRLHQMGLALQMYVDDHENKYPYYVNPYDPSLDDEIGRLNTRYWWAKLLRYDPVKWTDVTYHCPGYNGAIAGEKAGSADPPFGSYAYNNAGVSFPRHDYPYNPDFGLGPATFPITNPRAAVPEHRIMVPSNACDRGKQVLKREGQWNCGWLRSPDMRPFGVRLGLTIRL